LVKPLSSLVAWAWGHDLALTSSFLNALLY